MATTVARSLGTKTAYSTGTVSTNATGLIVTLSGGTFDTNWGEGDNIRIYAEFNDDFNDDYYTYIDGYVLSRDSGTQLTLQSAVVANLSGIGYLIQRSYSTLQTWAAACPSNLVTADIVYKGIGYNDSSYYHYFNY